MAENQAFQALSVAKIKRLKETDRRLPNWLCHPIQFPAVNVTDGHQKVDEFSEYIDQDLLRHIKNKMKIDSFFPVQKCLIPNLTLQFRSRSFRRPNDVCISSPTGSGKTLAFAIPIVNYLKQSISRSLRAIVILPSRDLAVQVFKAFNQVCDFGCGLRCALAAREGQSGNCNNFFREIESIEVHNPVLEDDQNIYRHELFGGKSKSDGQDKEYVSLIDILICTPGTLVDLIHNSPGFTLKDLEILVIDEADRLITNHKHDWLNAIERSIFDDITECPCQATDSNGPGRLKKLKSSEQKRVCYSSNCGCAIRHSQQSKSLNKLLFSATLSSDPQLLMNLNLFQPRLFLATRPSIASTKIMNSLGSAASTPSSSPVPSGFTTRVNIRSELLSSSAIPDQLEEKMFITESKEKLFVLWYLFHELKYKKVICFVNQLPSSNKLCKFFNQIHEVRAVEFSSNSNDQLRQKLLTEFKNDKIDVIVSTDLMARGMDIEGVEYVISYDMPASEIYYVHRVGRTARAGNKGTAITLVDTKQLVQFKKIVQLAHKMPNSMRLSDVVEEMKVPQNVKKNAEKYELYTKTLEDFHDAVNASEKKSYKKPK